MKNKINRLYKIIKIDLYIFGIIFCGYIVYSMFFRDGMDLFWIMYIGGGIHIIAFTIFVVVYVVKLAKEYKNELISTKPKHKFKYLDTFYYVLEIWDDDTPSSQYFEYHIIEDLDSKKVYAIAEQNTNIRFEKMFDKTKVLRIDDIDGVSTRKDWKEVNYGDEGSFWIDEELADCYQRKGDKIIINYFEKHKLKVVEISNRNTNYDISLLDKVTFITGYAQLDSK